MTIVKSNSQAGIPFDTGSALQWPVPAAILNLATTIPINSSIQSAVIPSNGWQKGSIGLVSSQGGNLSVQRFIDIAGTIPVGAPITAALTATTAASVSWSDGVAYASFRVTVSNASLTAAATLSAVGALLQAG